MARLSFDQIRSGLLTDPSIYLQNLSLAREAALILRLDRSALAAASFLDDRILTPQSEGRWTSFSELTPLLRDAAPARPLHFIFHAGHVGSTLISRMLDQAGGVLSLREPLPLRVLAEMFDEIGAGAALASEPQAETLLGWVTALWARGYQDTQSVIVKATSSAGRLAPRLLRALSQARALNLNLRAEPYLAALLAGQNSYIDLRGQAPERYRRLLHLAGAPPAPLHAMALGEVAALTWLAETLTQRAAQAEHGERILALDFDDFLAAPEQALRVLCAHFGMAPDERFLANTAESPALQRYSKAPERTFTPQLRAEILAESRARNAEQIHRGMTWLDCMARTYPAVARALSS